MKTRKFDNSALEVSALGFGCMGLNHAHGTPMPRHEAIGLLRQAVEAKGDGSN